MLKKILLALALLCAAQSARADSMFTGGASNITIGSTTVTGTAGLLYSDGTYVQSLPGTFYATDPNWTGNSPGSVFAFGNDQNLALTTDKLYNTAPLSITNTNPSSGIGNLFELYVSQGSKQVVVYFDNGGDFFSRLSMTVSGHVGGTGAHQSRSIRRRHTYLICMPPGRILPDRAYLARDNAGIAGEYSFMGLTAAGVTTLALDARDTQIVFGSQTVGSGQIFTGNAFFGSTGAATFLFGGADAAAPIAQTFSFQNTLTGTSNIAGANTIFDASMGTGTGASGAFEFFTAPAGSSGTSQNALSLALTIGAGPAVTIGQGGNSVQQLVFTPNSGTTMGLGSANSGSGLLVFYNGGQAFSFQGNNFASVSVGRIGFTNSSTLATSTLDTALTKLAAGEMALGNGSAGDYSGTLKLTSLITAPLTYATLPASPTAGQRAYITDGNSTTYYATVSSGGGSSKISVLYNGSNWIVD